MAARVYATLADYQDQTGDTFTPAPRVDYLLRRASQTIDRALIGAVYPVDTNSMPTDPTDIDTFSRATVAQAAFMRDLADDTGTAARNDSTSIGGVTVHRAAGTAALALPPLGPEALEILHLASASPISPMTHW